MNELLIYLDEEEYRLKGKLFLVGKGCDLSIQFKKLRPGDESGAQKRGWSWRHNPSGLLPRDGI